MTRPQTLGQYFQATTRMPWQELLHHYIDRAKPESASEALAVGYLLGLVHTPLITVARLEHDLRYFLDGKATVQPADKKSPVLRWLRYQLNQASSTSLAVKRPHHKESTFPCSGLEFYHGCHSSLAGLQRGIMAELVKAFQTKDHATTWQNIIALIQRFCRNDNDLNRHLNVERNVLGFNAETLCFGTRPKNCPGGLADVLYTAFYVLQEIEFGFNAKLSEWCDLLPSTASHLSSSHRASVTLEKIFVLLEHVMPYATHNFPNIDRHWQKSVNILFDAFSISQENRDFLTAYLRPAQVFAACNEADPTEALKIRSMADDLSWINVDGHVSRFTPTQSRCLSYLKSQHSSGKPWVHQQQILDHLYPKGSSYTRLREIFRRSASWGNIIVGNQRGEFRLNLDFGDDVPTCTHRMPLP